MKKTAKFLTFITWIFLFFFIIIKKDFILKNFLLSTEIFDYTIFILIPVQIIFSIFILPCSAITIIYGGLMGFKYGFILCFLTSYISSLITYKLASTKFNPFIFYDMKSARSFITKNVKYKESLLIFFSYANPLFPGSSLGYIFGITKVKYYNFVIYSFLGMIPLNIILVYFGDFLI